MSAYTDEQWARAKFLYESGESSLSAAAATTGIHRATARHRALRDTWKRPDGTGPASGIDDREGAVHKIRLETERTLELGRAALAERLLDEANELLDRATMPTTYKEVKVVPAGRDMGSDVEIVEVDVPHPTATDVRNLAVAFGIFIDKSQLLSGEATSREGQERTPEERRARMAQIRDELAQRRSDREAAEGTGTDG